MRVLIAEDEALIRMDLREMLDEEGHEVVGEARDGAEAIELARELRPDIVFMDVKMPGMDGIAAAREIGERAHRAGRDGDRVLAAGYVEEATAAGAMAYIVKPFARRDIEAMEDTLQLLAPTRDPHGLRVAVRYLADDLDGTQLAQGHRDLRGLGRAHFDLDGLRRPPLLARLEPVLAGLIQ